MSSRIIARGEIQFSTLRDGVDGNGVEYAYVRTNDSTPPTIVNTADGYKDSNNHTYLDDGFLPLALVGSSQVECTPSPLGVDSSHKYEWIVERQTGAPTADGLRSWEKYSGTMSNWSKFGDRGTDGDGVEYVFARTTTDTPPTISNDTYNNTPANYKADDFLPHVTGATTASATDDPQGTDSVNRYEWVMMRSKGAPNSNGVREWNKYTLGASMAQWSKFADDGRALIFEPSVINMDDSISVRSPQVTITGDDDIDGNATGFTTDPMKFWGNYGTTLRVMSGLNNVTRYAVVTLTPIAGNIATVGKALLHSGSDYRYEIGFTGFTTQEVTPLGYIDVHVEVRANSMCGAFTVDERVHWFITQNAKRDAEIHGNSFFEEDGNGNIKLKDEYGGLWTQGFLTAGGRGSGGGGSTLDLDRMWQSLTNAIADSHASDKIAVDHIPIVVKVGTTSYNPASTGAISLPAYPTTLPASDVYAWAKAASKPSYAFSEITGSATAGQLPAIENLINFATKVYDASASRTKNTVLAAPNGSNGAATFRALVAADIPSLTTGKISDLETWIGNKGFVTKAVNDLTYYYAKSNTYTKTEVNNLIAAINQFHYEIYASTSQVVDPQPNVLYLIGPTGTGSDKYEEYVYANSTWTKIGDTTIDLSQYINSVVASGSGNYVTGISRNGNTITVNYGTLPTTIALANVSDADDLKAIEALSGTSGFLKKTAANTWSLDTKAYLPLTAGSSYPLTGDLHTTSNIFANPEATETEAAFLKEFRINLMGHSNVYTRILWGRETKNKSNGAIIHYTYLNGGHFTCSFQEVAAGDQGYRYFTIGASTPRSSSNSGCGGIRLYGQTEMDSERAYYVSLRPGVVASNKTIVIPDKDGTMALTTDNVASATALANSRTIWGQSFNGSANVSGAMTGVTTLSASGAITAGSFVKSGGTSSQFLKADGSVDSSTYALLSELSTSELVLSGGIANVAARVQSIEDWLRFPALDNLEIDDTLGADIVRANDAYADIFHAATGVVSDGYVTAGAAASSSDARLKDNVQTVPFDKALSILNALRGVEWEWNEKKALLSGKHGSGLVAQEVEKVMPWAVLDLNGELSLNYNSLWGVAIPVMQSHEQRIQQLEAENKALREELETIKAR